MNLNDTKIVVAIENAVCDQLEASGIKADPFRLDGEKIVQVIIEQLGGYVVVPKEPTPKMIDAIWNFDEEIQDMRYSMKKLIEDTLIAIVAIGIIIAGVMMIPKACETERTMQQERIQEFRNAK